MGINWKIKDKLIVGMVVMILISVVLGILSNIIIKRIINSNTEVIYELQQINSLHEREVKHLKWVENLQDLFLIHKPFQDELDYTECDFGKWYYSFITSKEFAEQSNEFKNIIRNMEEPHKKLHESAIQIVKVHDAGDNEQARAIYENLTTSYSEAFTKSIKEANAYLLNKADAQINLANSVSNRAIFTNNFSILVAIFLGLTITFLLIKSIIRPITQFIEKISRMNRNEGVYQPIDDIFAKDAEIIELISSFNQMVVQVNNQQDELQQKNEELHAQSEELTAQNEEIRAQQEELEETLKILSQQEELLSRLYNFSKLLTQTIDFKELLKRILKGLQEEVGADAGAIYIFNKETKELQVQVHSGIIANDLKPILKLGEGLAGRAAEEKRVLIANYNEGQLRSWGLQGELKMAAEIYIPLIFQGQLLGVIALGRLKSNRFTAEKQKFLIALADQIAVAIDNSISHLETNKALEKIQEVDKLKSEMINTVSHELRTPLASILGFAELMLKKPPGEEKGKKYLATIHKEAERLSDLINDFLDLQRIENGRFEFNKTPVDLGKLIKDSIELYRSNKHNFILELDQELPVVNTDPDRVAQVLRNILSNAVKYSPEGGDIIVKAIQRSNDEVQVSVTDNGLGIPEEAQKNLFQPFFRVDNSDRRQIGGTGLGLAICKEIINVLGGNIWFNSVHGKGSTFYFTLPISNDIPMLVKKKQVSRREEEITPNDKVILIVEDDQAMANLISEALNSSGYQTKIVDSGHLALEYIKEKVPQAIVLDLILNGPMDGWEVLRLLKKNPSAENIPVIISSSLDHKQKGMAIGASDYLVKPFSQEKLVESINKVVKMEQGFVGMPQQNCLADSEGIIKQLLTNKGFEVKEIKNEGELLVINLKLANSRESEGCR